MDRSIIFIAVSVILLIGAAVALNDMRNSIQYDVCLRRQAIVVATEDCIVYRYCSPSIDELVEYRVAKEKLEEWCE